MARFEVREKANSAAIEIVERVAHDMAGWAWVSYGGKRYELLGGIRGLLFINLSHPIR